MKAKHVYTEIEKVLICVGIFIALLYGIIHSSSPTHSACSTYKAGDRAVCEQLHNVSDSGK